MLTALRKQMHLLSPKERARAALLLVMILIMALLEVIGVASIMPYMAVLADQKLIETNAALNFAYVSFGFTDARAFLLFLGVIVFVILVCSQGFKTITTYAQLRFIYLLEYGIARRLVDGYLNQPYVWFLNRHSADLAKNVLSEVGLVVHGMLLPMITLVAQISVAMALLLLLVVVDHKLAMMVGGGLVLAYGVMYALMSGFLSRIGRERKTANQRRFTVLSEAFGAAKEIKIGGLEGVYVERFSQPALVYAKHQASASSVSQLPRYVLEAMAFGGILALTLYLLSKGGGISSALPVIALYAFAGYRLLPAIQNIYVSLTQLRYGGSALDNLHADLISLNTPTKKTASHNALILEKNITLSAIEFRYPNTESPVLNGLDLSIPARSIAGLVGATGSGKTTAVDLIMGLLEPASGKLEVDGVAINESNIHLWQRSIGYVPQQIFLADDSIAANIAFGVESLEIDMGSVERAARIANLHDFVASELPSGYSTIIGERGVRLSGGQRQRIGIARALYHNPQVLILDEATSALDNLTERAVMEAVGNLGHKITIILIAHRLTTVRECDVIYMIDRGKVIGHGKFEDLLAESESFRKLAHANAC